MSSSLPLRILMLSGDSSHAWVPHDGMDDRPNGSSEADPKKIHAGLTGSATERHAGSGAVPVPVRRLLRRHGHHRVAGDVRTVTQRLGGGPPWPDHTSARHELLERWDGRERRYDHARSAHEPWHTANLPEAVPRRGRRSHR